MSCPILAAIREKSDFGNVPSGLPLTLLLGLDESSRRDSAGDFELLADIEVTAARNSDVLSIAILPGGCSTSFHYQQAVFLRVSSIGTIYVAVLSFDVLLFVHILRGRC